MKLYYIYSS